MIQKSKFSFSVHISVVHLHKTKYTPVRTHLRNSIYPDLSDELPAAVYGVRVHIKVSPSPIHTRPVRAQMVTGYLEYKPCFLFSLVDDVTV